MSRLLIVLDIATLMVVGYFFYELFKQIIELKKRGEKTWKL